ncbi:MAG: PucR family transcriptional regulator [Pseudonocardiaceae bacterium]
MDTESEHLPLPELVPAIVHRLPEILTEVGALLTERQPEYASFLAKSFEEILGAAEGFITRLVALAGRDSSTTAAPQVASGIEQALFQEIGRLHYQQKRDVTPLLAAYRTGAEVTWRHMADAALELGVPAEALAGLAAAVFAAVNQLSSASWRGYVQAQSAAGQDRERLRGELTELLLSDRCDTAALRAAAARAEWPLPRQAAVVLIEPDNEVGRALLNRLDDSCLRLRQPTMLVAIVPDPQGPGARQRLERALRGAGAVVGATVPLDRLPASVDLAEHAVRLRRARLLSDDPLFVDEHLDAMLVHHDDQLLAALRQQYLAPLAALPGPTRDRLQATLTSWLLNMGNHKAVAQELHVHPQTVRYRLTQLRERFGTTLEDPATRSALLLALAWGPAITETDPLAPRPEPRQDQ